MRCRVLCAAAAAVAAAALAVVAAADGELDGVKLRCCYLLEAPFVVPDLTEPTTANVSGLAITYLENLERRLGFKCNLIPYVPASPEYSGFSGFVDAMAACASPAGSSAACACDMGVGAWALSSARRAKVDFPAGFTSEALRAVTRTSAVRETAAKRIFFLQAFTWEVWMAIAGLIVLHVFVTMADSGFAPAPQHAENTRLLQSRWQRLRYKLLKVPFLYRLRLGLINSAVHFLGQYSSVAKKSGTKIKLMNVLALIFGVFLLTMFQASVTVQVLVTVPKSEFGSILDVKSCRIPVSRMCYAGNGASKKFFDVALAPVECIQKAGDTPLQLASFDEGFQAVLDSKCDYFYTLEGQVLAQSRGRFCGKLTAVGKQFFETSVSYILPMNSSLTTPISLETLRLHEQDKLVSSKMNAENQVCPEITDATLGWDKMRVFFFMAFAGLLLMFVLMMLDRNPQPTVEIQNLRRPGDDQELSKLSRAQPGDTNSVSSAPPDSVDCLPKRTTGWSNETVDSL